MEFFKTNINIPFMRQRKWASIFSITIFLLSIISLFINGLNLGIDFSGGTQIEVSFMHSINTIEIRKNLSEQGFPKAIIRSYDSHHILIRIALQKELSRERLKKKLITATAGGTVNSIDYIGPQVDQQLIGRGTSSVIVALIAIIIYITLRFEFRFAISAAIALIHDPILILGIFSFFHLEFNLITLAAILTVMGYSLNDTIVVYDRIRENFRKCRHNTSIKIINLSINQILSRTIITSSLILTAVTVLFIFGGNTLRLFSLALIIGIIVGTYSSIYIAGSLTVAFGLKHQHLACPKRKIENNSIFL
ncbi:protein translocase subunit SecF [Coxiella endosymbiont of Amblyomma americanum]|uniref:protein translocase subunit SecF n=1 Tax=Coxiella endosymbiont of Amblyomma americanum TaxID=325775 RepID=UPI00057DA5FB|nr:protein translocase subunit SecF [Coxiella endosymbiont of Amblyomma americanum]AJC50598.1 preprotein translocase subunit SecF [Coxiella endosymbiont of Amblyomma americanum]